MTQDYEMYKPPWRYGRGPIPRYLVRPTARFMRIEAAGGIVIVFAAAIALIWANLDVHSYENFWHLSSFTMVEKTIIYLQLCFF